LLPRHGPRPRARGPRTAPRERLRRLFVEEGFRRHRGAGALLPGSRRLSDRGRRAGHRHRRENAFALSLRVGTAMKNLSPLLKKIARLRILVVGDVMLDHYIWGDATRISPEAPVPVVDIARESWTAGGAANVALNIASLGARCTVAGFLG